MSPQLRFEKFKALFHCHIPVLLVTRYLLVEKFFYGDESVDVKPAPDLHTQPLQPLIAVTQSPGLLPQFFGQPTCPIVGAKHSESSCIGSVNKKR